MSNGLNKRYGINPVMLLLQFWLLVLASQPLQAGDATPASVTVTPEQIDSILAKIEADKALPAEEKTALKNQADNARNRLRDLADYQLKISEYGKLAQQQPEPPKEISLPDEKFEADIRKRIDGMNSEKLEIERIHAQNELTTANFGLKDLENRQTSDSSTLAQDANEREAAQTRIKSIQTELDQLQNNSDATGLKTEARKLFLKARLQANQLQVEMLRQRALSAPVRKQSLNSDLQSARAEVARANAKLRVIQDEIARQSMNEAEQIQAAITKAEQEAADKPEIIREQLKRNASLGTQLSIMLAKMSQLNRQKERLQALNQEIENNFNTIQKRLEVAGLNAVLGEVLRKQDRKLALIDLSDTSEARLQEEAEWAGIQQLTIDSRRAELDEVPGIRSGKIDIPASADVPEEQKQQVGSELFLLMQAEKELLDKLEKHANDYLRSLEEASFQAQQLSTSIDRFRSFLDEHLLWTPSAGQIDWRDFPVLLEATRWFVNSDNWLVVADDLHAAAQQNLPRSVLFLSIAAILILTRPRISGRIRALGDKVAKLYTDKFIYTPVAISYLALIHLPVPLLLFAAGSLLTGYQEASSFSIAVGHGLRSASLPWFMLNLFYSMYRPKGIMELHLQWPKQTLRVLRYQLFYLRFALPSLLFVVFMSNSQPVSEYTNSLGRVAFIASMLVSMFALIRILSPGQGALSPFYKKDESSNLRRMRWPILGLGSLFPLVIIGFAAYGYYASALELQRLFIMSIRVTFLSIVAYSLALRIMNLSNRRLAVRKAREKREAAKAEKEAAANQLDGAEGTVSIPQEELDIPTINAQTRQIVSTTIIVFLLLTLWAIWENLFPALSVTDQFVLWQSSYTVDDASVTENITLANLLAALVYVILSIIVIRNLPGIMELLFFQNMPSLDTGSRYAFTQLLRYAMTTVALLLVTSQLGGHWEQVQFLVAALGVGLGFGLQEIFANMISGIIILFERPIRVGDTVSVGGISGNVARIQMRATTITDWDRKELIVPNKTFITEQLVNWTLTDAITRMVIPVGIAYGSDIDKAQSIFKEVIENHPQVLKDPAPQVFFISFGDSSLNFEIRVFVKDLASRLPLQHDLHFQLTKALAEHGIEIPFPQRDLHLRSMPEQLMPQEISKENR